MPTDVIMPQMGESIFEGTLTKWLKKPGEKVTRDEPLFEISTDKVDAEIPAPASGVLKEVKVKEGTTVQVNTVVGVIDGDGAAASSAPAKAAPTAETAGATKGGAASTDGPTKAKPASTEKATPQAEGTPAKQQPQASESGANGGGGAATEVIMPQMGESIFEGTLTKWLKNVGDKVTRDEPLFEISTDKVDAEIPAPASGVLREIKVQAGTTVQVNSVVGVIGGAGAGASSAPPVAKAAGQISPGVTRAIQAGETEIPTQMRGRPEVEPAAKSAERQAVAQQPQQVTQFNAQSASGERIRSSPLVRRIAKDNNVDLAQVPGTGLGNRITRDDILGFVDKYGKGGAPAPTRAAQPSAGIQAPPARPAAQPMQAAFQGAVTLGADIADEV